MTYRQKQTYQNDYSVYSSQGGYNSTSLAVKESLEEVFNTFCVMITDEFNTPFKQLDPDDSASEQLI